MKIVKTAEWFLIAILLLASGCGSSTTSVTSLTDDTVSPSAPTNFQASPTSTSISLSWSAATDNVGVTGYRLTRLSPQQVFNVTGTSHVDTGLTPDTAYNYEVKAIDAAGNISAAASVATRTSVLVVDNESPTAPTGLAANAQSTRVDLTWNASTDNVGVAFYEIYRDNQRVGVSSIRAFTDTGLTKATQYAYHVKAFDGNGNASASSSTLNVTTANTNVNVSAFHSAVELTWARPVPAPDSYEVKRDGSTIASGLRIPLYLDAGASPGTYSYEIFTKTGTAAAVALADTQVNVTTNNSAELFTLVVENTSDAAISDVPVTIGQPFRKGMLKANDFLRAYSVGTPDTEITPVQLDRKALHADGTLRHGIISFIVPSLAANESRSIRFEINHGTSPVTPQASSCTLQQSDNITARIDIGAASYTANALDQLNASDTIKWLEGSVATEWIINGDLRSAIGTQHPDLDVFFHVRCYSSGDIKADIIVENTVAHRPQQNFTYQWTFTNGSAIEDPQTDLEHFARARFRKTLWSQGTPSINLRRDAAYVIGTRALPNYSLSSPPSARALEIHSENLGDIGPMGLGKIKGRFSGNDEASFDINWSIDYLLSGDKRAYDAMIIHANAAGSIGIHYRNSNQPVASSGTVPNVLENTEIGTHSSAGNQLPPENTTLAVAIGADGDRVAPDTAHQDSFAYMAYLLTGDYYLLEEVQFWANWNVLRHNPDFRQFVVGSTTYDGLVWASQKRGWAWILREMARAAYITPDSHPDKTYYNNLIKNNIEWLTAEYVGGTYENFFGLLTWGATDFGTHYPDGSILNERNSTAPWQEYWLTSVIGHIYNMDLLPNEGTLEYLRYRTRLPIGVMTSPQFCYVLGTAFNIQVTADTNSTPTAPKQLYTDWASAYQGTIDQYFAAASLAANASDCGTLSMANAIKNANISSSFSSLREGDLLYSNSNNSYYARAQGGVAAAVDAGEPGGIEAWQIFMSAPSLPDYTRQNRYNLVPIVE
jgi:chitodextrinase